MFLTKNNCSFILSFRIYLAKDIQKSKIHYMLKLHKEDKFFFYFFIRQIYKMFNTSSLSLFHCVT